MSSNHENALNRKVGYYEKDHFALQEAAQATIASLKALVEDKNKRIEEFQRQFDTIRDEYQAKEGILAQKQQQNNEKLYQENHQYINQLKNAMETIQTLENQGGGKAVIAAREMHEALLEELKQAHIALELKNQVLFELESKLKQCGEA